MPRAAKPGKEATRARKFADRRSFVSCDGHEYLYGEDRTWRRREVWERDGRRCVRCGEYVGWKAMEMDHRKGGNQGRCDCLTCNRHGDGKGNLQTMCKNGCHTGGKFSKHGR